MLTLARALYAYVALHRACAAAERKLKVAELEKRDLELTIAQLQHNLHGERLEEKARAKRRETELSVQKRSAAEARAEREKVKRHWEERLSSEAHRHQRESAEAEARYRLLEAELAAERESAQAARHEAAGLACALRVVLRWGAASQGALGMALPAALASDACALLEQPASEPRRTNLLRHERAFHSAFDAAIDRLIRQRTGGDAGDDNDETDDEMLIGPRPVHLTPRVGWASLPTPNMAAFASGCSLERAPSVSTLAADIADGAATAAGVPASAAHEAGKATSFGIEKDRHGNFVVVERDVVTGEYTVSAERAAAQHRSSSSGVPPGPKQLGPAALPTKALPSSDDLRVGRLSDDLRALLVRLGLEQFCERLEEEECFDVALLRSMGPLLNGNMREIGMDTSAIAKLQAALGVGTR